MSEPPRRQVAEDAPAGTVVASLGVADADAGGAPLAFLVAGGDERGRFQLRASGDVVLARPLDREARSAYSLAVAATDGKFTAYTTLDVTVTDVNGQCCFAVTISFIGKAIFQTRGEV